MPVRQRDNKWYWGSKGPFDSRKKAEKVAQAAHASGYMVKLLDFVILSKAPPFQVTPEGEVTPIKPIEGLEGQTSGDDDYEGKEITTRKYIKDPEDAPEVNGEKVKVYTGPKVGHFYDYSQLSSTEHKDEFTKIIDEAYANLKQGVDEMAEARPVFKNSLGEVPWVSVKVKTRAITAVDRIVFDIARARVNKIFAEGTDTPASRLAFQRERAKVFDEKPEIQEAHDKATKLVTEAYRGVLRNDEDNPYGETEQQVADRGRFEQLQTDYITAIIHSLHGKMEYHGGEDHLPTDPNVKIQSVSAAHLEYILPKVQGQLEVDPSYEGELLRRAGNWNDFINNASHSTLEKVYQRYENAAGSWMGAYRKAGRIGSKFWSDDIGFSPVPLTVGTVLGTKTNKYFVLQRVKGMLNGLITHELIHSGIPKETRKFLNSSLIQEKLEHVDHVRPNIRKEYIENIPFTTKTKGWNNNQQYFALVGQNNRQFFEEFPTEILAQRITSERFYPDHKDVDGEDGKFLTGIGYSGHGIEQFGVWLLKFVEQHDLKMSSREAKTPEGKAKIAKASRDICTELLDLPNMKESRRTVLSGSFASYARKHDKVHGLKNNHKDIYAYHVGVNPSWSDLNRYKYMESTTDENWVETLAKIPTVSAKKSDEFGSGMDKKALRRIILG